MSNSVEEERISVIVPIYNGEKYIKRCIECLLEQTYPRLEIILINDGSLDKTENICQKYAEQYENITYLFQHNSGAAAARNRGMNYATGKYVAFIDCDDFITRDYFEQLWKLLLKTDTQVACCSYVKGNLVDLKRFYRYTQRGKKIILDQTAALESLFYRKEIMGYPYCKLIERDLVADLTFPLGIRLGEDFIFVYKLLKKCKCVSYIDAKMYFYYQCEESVTHSLKSSDMKVVWENITHMQIEMEKKNIEVVKAIQSKLFVLACDFLIRLGNGESDSAFADELKEYIKHNCREVFYNRECKKSNRILAGMCCINRRATIWICGVILHLFRITGIHMKKAV